MVALEVIGGEHNFWLYSRAYGYDLTHPSTPSSPAIFPLIPLDTTKERVAIDPSKTALVVVDLQNYFLSPLLGRPSDGIGMEVVDKLLQCDIPACRKAGISVVWLGWSLTQPDVDSMPPAIIKGFAADTNFNGPRRVGRLGSDIGLLECENGKVIQGGQVLMRDQWNMALDSRLADVVEPQDIHVYRNRLSGFWGGTGTEETLKKRGIRTLLFAGAKPDQCVGGSLQDAFTKGWDCLLLRDACATMSPKFAQECIEYDCEVGWGFVLTCKQLADGVGRM